MENYNKNTPDGVETPSGGDFVTMNRNGSNLALPDRRGTSLSVSSVRAAGQARGLRGPNVGAKPLLP